MAATCFNCPTCNSSPCCCSTCQPANVIYQGECTDPGTLANLRYVSGLDYKFCPGRLTNSGGILNAIQLGSGNWTISFQNTPKLDPEVVTAAEDVTFGNLFVLGSDNRMRQLEVPASAGLFMQTNASGNLVLSAPPAATVPDPLVINDLTVVDDAVINDLVTNGIVTINNISSGTVANLLGLDASNVLVTQALAAGIAATMFFESSTSPNSGVAPNRLKVSGQALIIGNRLFDSGANLISVTTSESITVNVAGQYVICWQSQLRMNGNGQAGVWLVINGVVVNWGGGRTDAQVVNSATTNTNAPTGLEVRSLAVGDVLQLQLSSTAGVATYEVRLIALKFAD
jgi:hypothetical protein